ncbi:MAG: nucleotidyltransferase family protein [Pyrinomonadaceae bacterium]
MLPVTVDELENERRWAVLQARVQEMNTLRAVEAYRSHGLDPIVIKGTAAARYYPSGVTRFSADVDLAFARDQFARAQEVLKNRMSPAVAVDIHRELRHLDTLPWEDLLENSIELQLAGGSIRVLRPEDDLRVLCVHWLTDGGVYKERLRDIYYAIGRRNPDFDWERFLAVVSPRRQRWIECVLGLTAKYLDLDLKGTPVEGAERRLPEWFIRTVENEWSAEIKPQPLEMSIFDRKMLLDQVKRRMRPNAIFATVDCEGSFDARTRVFYQIRNGIGRIPSSVRRITSTLKARRQAAKPAK